MEDQYYPQGFSDKAKERVEAEIIKATIEGKYPPAEPGALCCEPLEAAMRGR